MRSATLFFVLGFGVFFLIPAIYSKLSIRDFQKNGVDSNLVQIELARYIDTVRATGPDIERPVRIGFMRQLNVSAGFKVIHDAALGDKAILKGPEAALDLVQTGWLREETRLQFWKAVLLERPVEFHINLDAHHMGDLQIHFHRSGEQAFWPSFKTNTPVTADRFQLRGCMVADGPIEIDNQFFAYSAGCSGPDGNQNELSGQARRLETSIGEVAGNFGDLSVEQAKYFERVPTGRVTEMQGNKILMSYSFENIYSQDDLDNLNIRPDTLLLAPGTTVAVEAFNQGENLPDSALVVLQYQ